MKGFMSIVVTWSYRDIKSGLFGRRSTQIYDHNITSDV